MSRERINEWALLRGFAFLAVVMQHSIGEYIYRSGSIQADSIMLGMLYHFTRFGTLTFVFLAGAILFYQYGDGRKYRSVIVKRIGDIYIPFVVWTIIYWIVMQFIFNMPLFRADSWQDIVQQLFVPTNGYHLWFVIMIFQFYLLFPLFRWLGKQFRTRLLDNRSPQEQQKHIIVMLIIIGIIYGWLMWSCYYAMPTWNVQGIWKIILDHRTSEFIFYFFYFVLGGICGSAIQRWRAIMLKILLWTVFSFLIMYMWLGYDLLRFDPVAINLNVSTYLKPTTFLAVLSHMLLMYGLALLLAERQGVIVRFLQWCGRYSFGGYLSHALILMGVSYFTRQITAPGLNLLLTLLTFMIVAPTAIALTSGLSRLPGGQWLTGSAGKKGKHSLRSHASRPQSTLPQDS
ncbi:acyltransferase [Paenibacillus nicotianae]|uniref:Acyltransferase n=1 Tax=Paenibacillus nicotianae TaxID=1526551 RepID=A0ABW4UXH7_9BACL